ncbi:DUF547 domain-containing protein [Pontivivens ytuae]|uniref:DUF547 domain-containing protein n=1 Tax=Pontivivens ytuae TaxID=2789856 RepID=A0A7S9LNV4_9RHOB|nr:DUF547 domain-containing protein [Pontivivens ytuae]QPH52549.1 DUF547 domain-containing protein [Pontivivens ytuae]
MNRRDFALALGAATLVPAAARAVTARLIDGPWQRFGSTGDPAMGVWEGILAQHLVMGADGVARVRYSAVPLPELRQFIGAMQQVDVTTLNRDAAFAYWANVYNAVTIAVVAEAWPVRSIRDIGGGLFSPGPWREKRFAVMGQTLSLDDIEHGIMRPVFGDARVHYAVNCASIGCPNLKATPWRAANLSAELDTAARAYVNHPRGVEVTSGGLVVSSIYDWFKADFGGTDAGVIAHLGRYAEDPAVGAATRIRDDRYDWAVNAV